MEEGRPHRRPYLAASREEETLRAKLDLLSERHARMVRRLIWYNHASPVWLDIEVRSAQLEETIQLQTSVVPLHVQAELEDTGDTWLAASRACEGLANLVEPIATSMRPPRRRFVHGLSEELRDVGRKVLRRRKPTQGVAAAEAGEEPATRPVGEPETVPASPREPDLPA
ncbi:hypothetical protein GCM10007977_048310 [Dactylosporangium sucinum]|uniref:Uncharacterized protein n=1 Tax=Dactylosporangium sucinum TaxID=1424081 RepID=A0A917TW23_9ACTN|nr:hypothetical protein GCM10007977_048310 [Dactylosporangium sucinum]